jgi:hypothetical protein
MPAKQFSRQFDAAGRITELVGDGDIGRAAVQLSCRTLGVRAQMRFDQASE